MKKKRQKIRFSKESLLIALILILVFAVIIFNYQNSSQSDAVSIKSDISSEKNIVVDFNYYIKNPLQANDLLVVKFLSQDKPAIKRVVYVDDSKITLEDGDLYINGESKRKIYLPTNRFLLKQVERKNYYMLPENTYLSPPNKKFLSLNKDYLVGKVVS